MEDSNQTLRELKERKIRGAKVLRVAPSPAEILALATASFVDVSASDLDLLTRKLKEPGL